MTIQNCRGGDDSALFIGSVGEILQVFVPTDLLNQI